ncbi:MAG: glucosamine-6-phosphate deaminase [Gemmatimonadota bacterium]
MPHAEHVDVVIADDHQEIARRVADRIENLIRERQASGESAVLGLATGSTPIGVYRELIRRHREEGLSFGNVVTFNLDEYYPMDPDSIHSYHRFMWENLFDAIDIPPDNVHIPRGDLPRDAIERHAQEYESAIRAAGGIDIQLLGIGKTGHVGFNEPGSGRQSRTRLIHLDTITRKDAAADFFGEENVPKEAVTMGVATIMEADEVVLIATGEHKAPIVRRAVEGEVSADVAATYLQDHPDATFFLDTAAAGDLTRIRTPWLVRPVEWDDALTLRAVVWLARQTDTAILRLGDGDYREHHLASLLAHHDSADLLNTAVFARLESRVRDNPRLPRGQRVIVFSPHPDDDVISMGGMLRKLGENENDVLVAYMTSGNIAVFDHEVRRYLDFVRRFESEVRNTERTEGTEGTEAGSGTAGASAAAAGSGAGGSADDLEGLDALIGRIEMALAGKAPGEVDIREVQDIKRHIRESEAIAGVQALGFDRSICRFLNLPFYQTGKVKKNEIGPDDVRIVRELLEQVDPDIIYVAGDMSDPHGTHRQCKEAIDTALADYDGRPEVWLYRGAWQEWAVHEADVFVPMSREDLRRKIFAIFKHQSQKDTAPFPGGHDTREFWQRVEDRNRGTARELDRLGLPEFHAAEAFVVRQRA